MNSFEPFRKIVVSNYDSIRLGDEAAEQYNWGGILPQKVVTQGNYVDTLVTIDPVRKYGVMADLAKVKEYLEVWYDHNITNRSSFSGGNLTFAFGIPYGGAPRGLPITTLENYTLM